MPELPEVQTTVQGLQLLVNKKITEIKIFSIKLRYFVPKNISKLLKNKKILDIYRIGKCIIFDFENKHSLIFHLGMSGRLKILDSSSYSKIKHDHILIYLKKNILIFNDPRKFGFVDTLKTNEIYKKKYIASLGIDALSKNLNSNYLQEKICKSIVPIKQILLSQNIISGIGNIYASEILFDAKISPFTQGRNLKENQLNRIIKSIRKILKKAIKFGGSTLMNYSSTDGTLGNLSKPSTIL